MRYFIFVFIIWTLNLPAKDFIIAGSANMQYALEDLSKEYTKETGTSFKTVISSSGKLTAQIENGAPFSIFLSADMEYPHKLYTSGSAIAEPRVYAKGILVLWTKGNWNLKDFPSFFSNTKLKSIAIANPEIAPYGKEAIHVLEYYNLYEKVKPRLIYAESISQVNQYILSSSVDIGFTAKSAVTSKQANGIGQWIEIDEKSYKPIEQGMVILKYGLDNYPVECKSFYNFLFSDKARSILKKNGYIVDGL